MSQSQPIRRPQGARQRTQDRQRQTSLQQQSGNDAVYPYAQDGFVLSDGPTQGALPSAGTVTSQRGLAGGVSSPPVTARRPNELYYTQPQDQPLVDSPHSEVPSSQGASQGNGDGPTGQAPRSQRSLGIEAPRLYSSPVQSMASLQRESESPATHPSTLSIDSSRIPSLQSNTSSSMQSIRPTTTRAVAPSSVITDTPSTGGGPTSRQLQPSTSTPQEDSSEGNGESRSRSVSRARWAKIRRAVFQTPPQSPPLSLPSNLPPPSAAVPTHPGLRVTPATSSVSGFTSQGVASGFFIPRTGSALSFVTDAGLAPPPSAASSTVSSNVASGSRSARAVMNFRNVVDQARTGVVAGIGAGFSGAGIASFGGLSGGFGKGTIAAAMNPAAQIQMVEDTSPFAKEILQACSAVRLGGKNVANSASAAGGSSTVGSSAASSGVRKPVRMGTADATIWNAAGSWISAPGSTRSGATTPQPPPAERGSLKPLLDLVINQASILSSLNQYAAPNSYFPHQSLVLSTLLLPFLRSINQTAARNEASTRGTGEADKGEIENEQWLAVEIYGVFTKSWPTVRRPQEQLDRWLWCTYAAAQESTTVSVRSRLLLILDLAVSADRSHSNSNASSSAAAPQSTTMPSPLAHPGNFRLLLHALFLVYPRVCGRESEVALGNLNSIVSKLQRPTNSGVIRPLELEEIELEYGMKGVKGETGDDFRAVMMTTTAIRLLEIGSEASRRWYLLNFIEGHWPLPSSWEFSPLREQAEYRKLLTFLKAALSLIRAVLSSRNPSNKALIGPKVFKLVETRVFPELGRLSGELSRELCSVLVLIVLELLGIEGSAAQAQTLLRGWLGGAEKWKEIAEGGLRRMIVHDDHGDVIRCITTLRSTWPVPSGQFLSSLLISSLFERLTSQAHHNKNSGEYGDILRSLAADYPQVFYAPLFACARSSNRSTVSRELRTLNAISRAYPEFWTANPEMMCIALMSDPGVVSSSQGKGKQRAGEARKWGKARLGQSVLFLELIALARKLNKDRKDDNSTPAPMLLQAINFFVALEIRVAVLLEAKELNALCPFSTRLLIASLLLEIRLLSRSLKPASWLPKVVEWGCTSHPGAIIQAPKDPFLDTPTIRAWTPVTDEVSEEVDTTIDSIRALYSSSWLESMSTPRNKTLTLPGGNADRGSGILVKSSELEQNLEVLASLPSPALSIFKLLVVVSGILHSDHYTNLGPILWNHYLDSVDANFLGPVAFLLMQSAEKDPSASVTQAVSHDLSGTSAFLKRRAMDRLAKLFSWRHQVLTQPVITDRAHRRPFKSGRPPLSFVPTDIGSLTFVPDKVEQTEKLQFASALHPEIHRRLVELGWDKDAPSADKQPAQDMAPLSVVPSDRLAGTDDGSSNATKGLLRRKSSSSAGYSGGKRRPIFTPSFALQLNTVLRLATSMDPETGSTARLFILEVLRDDPALFARPILEQLSHLRGISVSVALFERAFRLQAVIPSAFSHLVFNHLSGLLKTLARDVNATDSPMVYAYSLPAISLSASFVSGISIRELRKAKMDSMMLPSGSLWFTEQMLPGPMFPRGPSATSDPSRPLPPELVAITMVRTAQNVMLTTLLRRDPKEVHTIRKSFTNFTLPNLGDLSQSGNTMELADYLPRGGAVVPVQLSVDQKHLFLISLALSRSHLLLVAQIFRCLSRQTNDYQEISQLLDGVNRILLRHGNDLGIVTHAMIDYMIAMTRFRRLFSSNGGFMLVMPAIWKTYCESEGGNNGIRGVIEYAINRFHAVHPEAFVFQSVDVAAVIMSHPNMKNPDNFASNVTSAFISLGATARNEGDAGGIQNVTKMYEREAIINSINDSPEIFNNSFQRGESMSTVVDQFEGKTFPLENLARLCLTVIADDPFILRAEQFLTLFRYLTPKLYQNSMTARTFVGNGIDALGTAVFSKASVPRSDPRAKAEDSSTMSKLLRAESNPTSSRSIFAKANSPSNFLAMKQEYLHLIVEFTKVGGQLPSDVIRRALELLRGILRDSLGSMVQGITLFLHEFAKSTLLREGQPPPRQIIALLSDIVPLIQSHGQVINFSGVFDVVAQLCKDRRLVEDPVFSKFVIELTEAAFSALETAAAANTLQGMQFREAFVSLLVALVQTATGNPLSQLRGRSPSAGLLATVILPVCLRLPKASTLRSGADSLRRAWAQLLGFVLSACGGGGAYKPNSATSNVSEKQGLIGQGIQNSPRGMVAGLLLAIQLIKVIVIRAGEDVAYVLPDVWLRIASVIQDIFRDGNGAFSVTTRIGDQPSSSPIHSRPGSPNGPADFAVAQSTQPSILEMVPRATDYGVWSILELLCFYRTPLNIQLRLWLHEKLLQLEARVEVSGGSPNRSSFVRDARRLSFSPFTKTRRRSGIPSAPVSPEGSPSFRPLREIGTPPPLLLGSPTKISAFDRFPQASPPANVGIPRIRHLGPEFQAQAKLQSTRGPGGEHGGSNPLRAAAKLISISQPFLVRESHRRVEAVRIFWGYESFTDPAGDMSAFEAWTSTTALKKIVEECRELEREFSDVVKLNTGN